jgi:transposase
VIPWVRDRHRSCEFIEFLQFLDGHYLKHRKSRLVLDNHAPPVSKETQRYLLTCPERFEFVFTPKHGSWLNLIEMFFSKLPRSFLRHIRVASKEELIARIYQGIEAMNQEPGVFRWRYKMDEVAVE